MGTHSPFADHKVLGDLRIALASRNKLEYFQFSLCQWIDIGWGRLRGRVRYLTQ
jgi:hypothetical protein